jgi:hypothetical protein
MLNPTSTLLHHTDGRITEKKIPSSILITTHALKNQPTVSSSVI